MYILGKQESIWYILRISILGFWFSFCFLLKKMEEFGPELNFFKIRSLRSPFNFSLIGLNIYYHNLPHLLCIYQFLTNLHHTIMRVTMTVAGFLNLDLNKARNIRNKHSLKTVPFQKLSGDPKDEQMMCEE